jgi:hypothetical protein
MPHCCGSGIGARTRQPRNALRVRSAALDQEAEGVGVTRPLASRTRLGKTPTMAQPGIVPCYCKEPPSLQTALDIFRGFWKSGLPSELGLVTGPNANFFQDPRVLWANELLEGGFHGLDVLELGPFEGYDTYLFERLGARHVTAVEGNNVNFLKCLLLKDVLKLRVELCHGDVRGFLRTTTRNFELIWASGVLYHSDDPLDLLQLATQRADRLFIWTHYFPDSVVHPERAVHFPPDGVVTRLVNGTTYTLHRQNYFGTSGDQPLPLHWEGGTQLHSYWLEREGILGYLRDLGFSRISINDEGELDHLPYIGFLAERPR